MNREQFKQRMKSLKSYREQNPGKGYWDWKVEQYDEGGEVPPDNSIVRVNPITGKPLANGMAYTTIPSRISTPEEQQAAAETALSFIPYVGDAISVKDLTQSISNKDWIGASLAGLSLIPFVPRLWRSKASKVARPIPEVNPNYFQEALERSEKISAKRKETANEFYRQQDAAYESLIENEDAFRRAVSADKVAGTDYKKVYEDYIRKYSKGSSRNNDDLAQIRITDDMPSGTKATVNSRDLDWINVNERYIDPSELDPTFQKMNPGLVRHELGHITDEKAGLDYVDKLGKRSKFEPEEKLREMYPSSYRTIQSYLLKGSEIKSHMNEFREFLRSKHEDGVKETVRSMREKLDRYRDEFRNLKVLFDAYKSKRQFVKDYNTIPLIGTSALGINYYLNQQEEK